MPGPRSSRLAAQLVSGLALALVAPGCGDRGRSTITPVRAGEATTSGAEAVTTHADDPRATAPPRLWVAPSSADFSGNPALLARILATPHGYFRFINRTFSEAVCEQFRDDLDDLPTVNLHGDAHLEQYAATDLGRGLTDFDDSATGPPILDLMRITTSMRLAAYQLAMADGGDALVASFFRGYRAALADPDATVPEPSWAARTRAAFRHDRPRYLLWAQSLMSPLDDAAQAGIATDVRPYVETMKVQHPELAADFFHIENVGRLQMGIGSALDEKYLLRIRGASAAPVDDVFLEAKEVRDLTGISCMRGERRQDPFRILVGQSRIAYVPYPYLGYVRMRGRVFWIHGWVDNYDELDLGTATPADLGDIAEDIGIQLGRGHPRQIASPLDLQLRRAMIEMVEQRHPQMEALSKQLAEEIIAAWQRFRREAPRGTGSP